MASVIGLLGDGHQADETEDFGRPAAILFRAVASQYLESGRENLIDIATSDEQFLGVPVISAVGAPGLRRTLVRSWSGTLYASVVADGAWISPSAKIGSGTLIAPNAVISTKATLGDHVLVNISASVSHDSVLGDFVTLSPGARVAGKCRIGDGVFLGIGAVVSDGISIASGTVVGAGAVVIGDILLPGVYVGVPAKKLRDQEGWLSAI
ncbi:MAG: acetyltransferase [Candidatus Saccharibacteria bacterium]|nr:acetyltransferase [Microbacteriaceae bacterium]